MLRKLLVILLCIATVISFAACGNTSDSNTNKTSDTEKTSTASGSSETTAVEKVKIRIAYDGQGRQFPEGVDENNNPYIQWLRDTSGMDIEVILLPREDADSKVTMMIAVDDIPDIITLTANASSSFQKFAAYGTFKALDEELKNAQNITKYMPEALWLAVKHNGKIMGIPRIAKKDGATIPIARIDWLEKLGLNFPVTSDEYYNVAKSFTEQDPDGDGKNNTVGFTFNGTSPSLHGIDNIFGAFGAPREGYKNLAGIWLERDGKLSYTGTWPENKDALAWLQKIYLDGYLDKEFITNVWSVFQEKFTKGVAGMTIMSPPSTNTFRNATVAANEKAKVDVPDNLQRFRVEGKTPMYAFPSELAGYTGVTGNVKQSLIVLDLLASPEGVKNVWGGKQGELWDIIKNPDGTDGFTWVNTDKSNADAYRWALFNTIGMYDSIVMPLLAITEDSKWRVTRVYTVCVNMKNDKNNEYVYDRYLGAPTQTYSQKWTELCDLELQAIVKIISGNKPVEYYDEFLSDWKSRGGDKITEEVNEWYKNIK